MNEVFRVPLDQDLSGFTAILWQHKIPHRVLEQGQEQLLLVPYNVNGEQIAQLYQMWQQGADLSGLRVQQAGQGGLQTVFKAWLTLALIAVSIIITLIVSLGDNIQMMGWFTIVEFSVQGNKVYYSDLLTSVAGGQIWRLFTPAFMHFNLPHIIFNLLWVWVVGRRIESYLGWPVLLGLFLFSALASNIAQFWVSGPMFGGMSGFVFALLGFAWLWDRLRPAQMIGMPPALMGFMMFWLVLGFTGALETLGLGSIANTAHLAGLIAGLVVVPVVRVIKR
ncbi:rhomboid family intramembrane serine protease [Amphritea pacifica]|uniref:Rhomboid family intramembrane serine protease n=1 Tax=Amphritea pacifica TaxID=2811233 RepID=A0ABS2W357_9GAMM|nr:rhomboid family intramembrane serine protease [Amphritea pacifica]MBN0986046.1 rhomboid family intramembrane serine protease [Amphritea pacifica]MBN1006826.1 rhomboid family intramembrane serine protease [Amphritea pacifica]